MYDKSKIDFLGSNITESGAYRMYDTLFAHYYDKYCAKNDIYSGNNVNLKSYINNITFISDNTFNTCEKNYKNTYIKAKINKKYVIDYVSKIFVDFKIDFSHINKDENVNSKIHIISFNDNSILVKFTFNPDDIRDIINTIKQNNINEFIDINKSKRFGKLKKLFFNNKNYKKQTYEDFLLKQSEIEFNYDKEQEELNNVYENFDNIMKNYKIIYHLMIKKLEIGTFIDIYDINELVYRVDNIIELNQNKSSKNIHNVEKDNLIFLLKSNTVNV